MHLRLALDALLDLVLPGCCAACDGLGVPLCADCTTHLRAELFEAPRQVAPDPTPAAFPPVTACGPYAGVLKRMVTAYKDEDRRDLGEVLGPLLLTAVRVAAPAGDVALVPVPSSRAATRRRGDAPVTELARHAVRRDASGRLTVLPAVGPVRRLADQAGLDHLARAANLAGAYAVRPRFAGALGGRRVLLVDDVVTTGSTLAEAARAVRAEGGLVTGSATLAATRRRRGREP